jgi:iron(III) transport system substrate-binding protein
VYYSAATENVIKRINDAFKAKYGLDAEANRFSSSELRQRYSSEAQSGKITADFILNAGSDSAVYAKDGVAKGWMEPLAESKLPAIQSGVYPAEFVHDGHAVVVQIQPWSIGINKNRLQPADYPKTWTDLHGPKFKGQILMADPKASSAYLDLWDVLYRQYGDSFFQNLKANNPKFYASGVPATAALGAGEGAVAVPQSPSAVLALTDQGAPVDIIIPDLTVGVEIQASMTAAGKAAHPNAAKLMVNFMLTEEGQKLMNADRGNNSVYDKSSFPKDYRQANPDAAKNKDVIFSLIGAS